MSSTEIDTYRPAAATPYVANGTNNVDPTGGRLVAWASSLMAAKQIANALCGTTFAPAHFRGKPDDGAAAIMFGDEIGLSPTQALRSIYVISGTPSLYARQMVAIVLHHGHEVWVVEKSDAKVTVAGKRRGSSHVHEETWTTARARQAGYLSNKRYTSNPQEMLYARAASDVCRQIAPDALAGLAYTVEELEMADQPTTTVRRAAEPKTTAKRAAPTPQPEPDLDPPTLAADDPIPPDSPAPGEGDAGPGAGDPITKAQLTKLHVLLGEAGMGDREAGLAYLSDQVDRQVESSKTLTKAEAHACIEDLTTLVEAPFPQEPPMEES